MAVVAPEAHLKNASLGMTSPSTEGTVSLIPSVRDGSGFL